MGQWHPAFWESDVTGVPRRERRSGGGRALQTVRASQITGVTDLLDRVADTMQAAAHDANDKVLLHPEPPHIVTSANRMVGDVTLPRAKLGLDSADSAIPARGWVTAAAELRDAAIERGTEQLDAVRQFGDSTGDRVRDTARSLRAAARARRPRELPSGDTEQPD